MLRRILLILCLAFSTAGAICAQTVVSQSDSLAAPFDFRWSITRGMLSPYLGLSAGIDLFEYPYEMFPQYLSAEAGFRVRLSDTSTKSTWASIFGEVGAAYANAGLKIGYSF